MKILKTFIILTLLIFLSTTLSYAGVLTEVVVNKSTIINLKKPVERVSVAKKEVADIVVISPTELQLNGISLGSTSLIIWEKGDKPKFFDVKVIPDINEIEARIKAIAPDDSVSVTYANEHIVLSGTVSNEQMINKILAVASAYAKEGTGIKTTRFSAGLTETVHTPDFKVLNNLKLKEAQQVLLEVKVAQIDKSKLKELGIGFLVKERRFELTAPGLIGNPTGVIGGDGPGFNVFPGIEGFDFDNLTPQIGIAHYPSGIASILKMLQTKGYAKILAEPNLIVRSGEKGNFLAGTKVPIQVVTGTPPTPSIEYRDVGVKLNFAPEVLETGVIRLKIDPAEVSNIIRFLSFAGGLIAPEIDTREVRTSVDLKEGESLILAGLLSEETKKNIRKIPILGDIPILGMFFRATDDELKEKELAFFITPKLIKPIAPGTKPELPTDKKLTPDEEREFQWIPLPKPVEEK
jgi:pilus assembly protein CpaC